MKLIIDIPEEQYNTIKSDLYNTFTAEMKKWGLGAIRNGIPLDNLRTEIQTEHDGILWDYNDYDDGWSDALKWVLNVIDKYTGVRE